MPENNQIFPGKLETAFQAAVRQIEKDMPEQLRFIKLQAKFHKAKYDALIKEGFEPEQALELCKKVTI